MKSLSEIIKAYTDDNDECSLTELAEKINMNYSTLMTKIRRDSFDYQDMLKIASVLNIDMNDIKDEVFLHTGTIGIWKEENCEKKFYGTRIDKKFYDDRGIDKTDPDQALLNAINVAVKQLFKYIDIDVSLSPRMVQSIMYEPLITIPVEDDKYYVALTLDIDKGDNFVSFGTRDLIESNKLLEGQKFFLGVGDIVIKTSHYIVKYLGEAKCGNNEYEFYLRDGGLLQQGNTRYERHKIECMESELFEVVQDILKLNNILV